MARTTLRSQLEAAQEEIADLRKANESVISDYTMLSRKVEELSYIDLNAITTADEDVLPQAKRVATINRIRRLRHENPIAKQAIKLILRFVLGKGVGYEIKDANTKRIVDAFWNDPINQAVWSDPQGLADLIRKIPMGRLGQREEIAQMARFLVSDAASYVTGTTVFVDGGMTDYADFAHGG